MRGGMEVIRFVSERDMPITAISIGDMSWNKTGTWRYLRPKFLNRTPPCNAGCPAGEDIEGVMVLVGDGRYEEALNRIREENPFPATCGRVCYHPCENQCNRGGFDEPLAIHSIERFVADTAYKNKPRIENFQKKKSQMIAIVGSGPAGLTCAYHLARMGYHVTLFEKSQFLGGMLRTGIPPYRLPKDVLDEEIEYLISTGIEVRRGIEIGKDIPFEGLEGYSAIFIATGASVSKSLGITGEDSEGIVSGLDFLREVNSLNPRPIEGRVAIIGGGNTAIDCARSALRLGGSPIVLYRRTREEMSAMESEVMEAEEEGVEIQYLVSPVRIHVEDGKVRAIECIRNRLGPPDMDGRRRPEPIKGSNFFIGVEKVISAIGEEIDYRIFPPTINIKDQLVVVDHAGRTTHKGIYSGGDLSSPMRMVVHAIASGKRAAVAIDCDLQGRNLQEVMEDIKIGSGPSISISRYMNGSNERYEDESRRVISIDEINLDYFEKEPRCKVPRISISERRVGFKEINLGLKEDMAQREAKRCFNCAVCNKCGNCFIFCPDMAVIIDEGMGPNRINYDYCKGCGICAEECPRAAIVMEKEIK
jgi:2-oxoacid:acceptor oxidoreductase delta subunit (pyruvate/2-ketoisovalerate family)